MKTVYIIGPFRGRDAWAVEQNVQMAEHAAMELAKQGLIPVCVHTMYRHFDRTLTDEFWLEATMEIMRRCDAVFVLGSAETSRGSRAEIAEAERLGLEFLTPTPQDQLADPPPRATLDP